MDLEYLSLTEFSSLCLQLWLRWKKRCFTNILASKHRRLRSLATYHECSMHVHDSLSLLFFPSIHLYIYDAFFLPSILSLPFSFSIFILSIHSFCLFSGLDAKRQVYFVVTGGIRWKKLVRLDSRWYFNRWSILILFLLHLLTEERTVFERRQEMEYEREREREERRQQKGIVILFRWSLNVPKKISFEENENLLFILKNVRIFFSIFQTFQKSSSP